MKNEIVPVSASSQPLSPLDRVTRNEEAVAAVAAVVKKNYIKRIGDKAYLMVAGAQAVGSSLGYTTAIESLRYVPPTEHLAGYWEAVAVVHDASGLDVLGRGFGAVFEDERQWARRDQFARQMMAQTRATGRALKGVMGWATALLGAESSLAEEMPDERSTMASDGSEVITRVPARLPVADAPATVVAAVQGKAVPKQVLHGECGGVQPKESKAGKPYWRVCILTAEGREWFTSFKEVPDMTGKRVTAMLRDDGKGGSLLDSIVQADEDPDPIPF